jgi:integrase
MGKITQWKLISRKGRPTLICRYKLAGRSTWREQATGKTRRRDAESEARKIVAKAEKEADNELTGWAEFKLRYEKEHLSGAAKNTVAIWRTSAAAISEMCSPAAIGDINADMLSRFAVRLREKGLSEATIKTYRTHILAALDWAVTIEILAVVPRPPKLPRVPKGTKSRGRALTREEAERIALALPKVVGAEYAKRWAWNLEGLWRSGMRITETLSLFWDPTYGKHWIDDLDGKRPKIKIAAESEKGFKERTVPMTPDFVAMLRAVQAHKRTGAVFRWPVKDGGFSESEFTIGRRISQAGKAAQVIVNKNRDGSIKYASAHDFRRSFGSRWAPKVMPIVLKELMRHESIETTMAFYVGANADQTADALWAVQSDEIGEMLSNIHCEEPMHELGAGLGAGRLGQLEN